VGLDSQQWLSFLFMRKKKKTKLKRVGKFTGKLIVVLFALYGMFALAVNVGGSPPVVSEPLPTIDVRPVAQSPKIYNTDAWLSAVNSERAKVGAKPLAISPALNTSAQLKAEEILKEGHYNHINKSGVKSGLKWATEAVPKCNFVSENLVNTSDLTSGIHGWLNSPSHRQALLDPRYEYTGFGLVEGYTVEHFADCS